MTTAGEALDRAEHDRMVEEARQMNALAAAMAEQMPDLSTPEGVTHARLAQERFFGQSNVEVEVIDIDGPGGRLPARVIRPTSPDGVYLDLHGGGWCIGSARQQDFLLVDLAREANVVTVSVDYRLAPEHPFPAAVDDAEAAVAWLIDEAGSRFGTERLAIGGTSAGAHLATMALLRVRDRRGADAVRRIAGANLLFGAYDLGLTPSARAATSAAIIPTATMVAFLTHFMPGRDPEALRHADCSPLYANLEGLPPGRFTVGALDPLLDDNLFMAARWQAAGNHAELVVYDESIHGFSAFPLGFGPSARAAANDFVRRAVRGALIRTNNDL